MVFPKTKQAAAILRREWDGLTVEYGRLDAVGEFDFAMPKQVLSVAFAPHEQVTWSIDGGQRQSTSLPAGSIFVYGQREFVWHRRVKPSEYINLAIDPALLQTIATENVVSLRNPRTFRAGWMSTGWICQSKPFYGAVS